MDINKKKQDRFKFLKTVYDIDSGMHGSIIDGFKLGKDLGFDRSYTTGIFYYLKDEGLIEPMGAGINLMITHYGIQEVEEALSEPEKPTEHFMPLNQYNTIKIENMNGGAIQQATNHSNITIVSNDVKINIENYIGKIKNFVIEEVENVELKKELLADIETIIQQNKSPKPKSAIIKATLNSLRDTLVGGLGGAIGTLITPKAQEIINYTEQILDTLPS